MEDTLTTDQEASRGKSLVPGLRSIGIQLCEARVDLLFIDHVYAAVDVLGPSGCDLALEGHREEGYIVDAKVEQIRLHIVVKQNLPLEFVILQRNRENTWLGELFPIYIKCD